MKIAETLEIQNKETLTTTKWRLTEPQRIMARESAANPWLYLAKPRQIYASTWFCFEDVLWTWLCDVAGERVRTAIVVDTDAKANDRLDMCGFFAAQLKRAGIMKFDRYAASSRGPERIVFPNGSEVIAFSAGGNRAGASMSFHRYHLTEMPFWRQASRVYGSLMPALGNNPEAQCKIETTLTVSEDRLAFTLWNDSNRYKKLFIPMSAHAAYRADPASITEDAWKWAQEEGWRDRSAAAFFLVAVKDQFGGDLDAAFHEYPEIPAHLFQVSAGRFIKRNPRVIEARNTVVAEGVNESWVASIYREPDEGSGQYIIGVDTAKGVLKDRSTVAVLDKRDWCLCASFCSDVIWGDDLAAITKALFDYYSHQATNRFPGLQPDHPVVTPTCVIEDNGVGTETLHAAKRRGVPAIAITTDEPIKLAALLWAKRRIESGEVYGPLDLAEECAEIHRDKQGRFRGRKDLAMAIGLAGTYAQQKDPYRAAKQPRPGSRLYFKERLRGIRH